MQFVRYLNALWAVWGALVTSDAVACLTQTGHAPVIAYEESTACLAVVLVPGRRRHIPLIDALVVVGKDAGYVDAVRTRHTILASGAWDGRVTQHFLRRIFQQGKLILRTRVER